MKTQTEKQLEREIEERLNILGKEHSIKCQKDFNEGTKKNKGWLKEMLKEERSYAEIEAEDDWYYLVLKAKLEGYRKAEEEFMKKIDEFAKTPYAELDKKRWNDLIKELKNKIFEEEK